MDPQMLVRLVALVEANLFVTVLVSVVYGTLLAWIIRETRLSHGALRDIAASAERIEASAERIAQMVHDLHRHR